jgi:diaminopimelate decarboxylase
MTGTILPLQIDATATAGLGPNKIDPQKEKQLKLTPKVHDLVSEYINTSKDQLFDLVNALGSPLNLLFPQILSENASAFESSLLNLGVQGRVYFAHKTNRSDSLVRQLSCEDAFIDVSSANELKHALGCGFTSSRIQATGPKNSEFLALCLRHSIVIGVDSAAELSSIVSMRRSLKTTVPTEILLRLSGFRSGHSQYRAKASRFGISIDQVSALFKLLQELIDQLRLLGFAFHLDTVSLPEKAMAIENSIALFDEAIELGFEPSVINIGGGFKVNYLAKADDWNQYTSALRDAALGKRPAITWQGNTFGLLPDKGSLRGNFNSYSYYDPLTGPRFLEELLAQQLTAFNGATAASLLRNNGISLWIEPGRALVDQAGITVARVNSLKTSSQGDTLVCLNMKRQDVCFLDQEIFVDPIIIRKHNQTKDASVPVYFTGNLCLESDLICRHQVILPVLPEPGDLAIFINTAGYFMDFSASESIMQPIARKAAIFRDGDRFAWTLDEHYFPWLPKTLASGENNDCKTDY